MITIEPSIVLNASKKRPAHTRLGRVFAERTQSSEWSRVHIGETSYSVPYDTIIFLQNGNRSAGVAVPRPSTDGDLRVKFLGHISVLTDDMFIKSTEIHTAADRIHAALQNYYFRGGKNTLKHTLESLRANWAGVMDECVLGPVHGCAEMRKILDMISNRNVIAAIQRARNLRTLRLAPELQPH